MMVAEPWPISWTPLWKRMVPSRSRLARWVEGLLMPVLPQPYQTLAMPTPRRIGPVPPVPRLQLLPARTQCLQTLDQADALEPLAGGRRVAGAERVQEPELERIDAELARQVVIGLLDRERCLGHAEAAKGAAGWGVGEDRPGPGPHVGDAVGAGCVDRHAAGDGRAPGRISARVEVTLEIEGGDAARRRPRRRGP